MSKLVLPVALLVALSGCLVEAIDPPGSSPGTNAGADAGTEQGDDEADAGPSADADPASPDAEPTPTQLLNTLGGCMRIADWDAANLGQIALVETAADGNCATCHSAGTGGAYLNADSILTFTNAKIYPYILRFAKLDVANAYVVSDDLLLKGQQAGHPTYTLPAALAQGITSFFNATNAHYIAGECPDPAGL